MSDRLTNGHGLLTYWPYLPVAAAIGLGIVTGFLRERRIRPGRFRWLTFRHEAVFAMVSLGVTAFALEPLNGFLHTQHHIVICQQAGAWCVVRRSRRDRATSPGGDVWA